MRYDPPQLFVIAGPNGAGKSTTSASLLKPHGLKAFDWDKEFYQKWSEFSYDPLVESGIRDTTNELFENLKSKAIANAISFAFETNFHTNTILQIVEEFQKSGFETNLYFLLVSNVDICKQRVAYRVREEQGHNVSTSNIEERFEKGLIRLNESFTTFSRTFIFDASLHYLAKLIATFHEGILKDKYQELPGELKNHLSNLHQVLDITR